MPQTFDKSPDRADLTSSATNSFFFKELIANLDAQDLESLGFSNDKSYKVQSRSHADRLAAELRETQNEIAQLNKIKKDKFDVIETMYRNQLQPLENKEKWLLLLLQQFAREELSGSTRKSLKLIEGTLQFKTRQPEVSYEESELIEYLQKHHPSYLEMKFTINKNELKKAGTVQKDGSFKLGETIVPGIRFSTKEDSFSFIEAKKTPQYDKKNPEKSAS